MRIRDENFLKSVSGRREENKIHQYEQSDERRERKRKHPVAGNPCDAVHDARRDAREEQKEKDK